MYPSKQVTRTNSATKNKGKCQILRDSPVRSKIIAMTHEITNPITPITNVQGSNRSMNRNSGWFSASATNAVKEIELKGPIVSDQTIPLKPIFWPIEIAGK
jgi:hypothetical protein